MGFLRRKTILTAFMVAFPFFCHAQENEGCDYERSSMHSMMIKHLNEKYADLVEEVFSQIPFPERFNNHDLGVKVISFAESQEEQLANIEDFVKQVNLGKKMVSKWFDRNKDTGSFDMNLIKQRGFYNASVGKRSEARASIRGKALLEDAGENLINNTYLLVNDMSYQSKGSGNWILKSIVGAYTGNINRIQKAYQGVGGFEVTIKSYLFRLRWNDDIAMDFYTKYYTENGIVDNGKVKSFKADTDSYVMNFVGETICTIKKKEFTALKDPKEYLLMVTKQAIDQNIAQLQHQYPDFRIKAPLLSVSPLKADVGVKEGIDDNTRFEVLEREITEEGKVKYERVGVIRPIKGKVKDNRYMITESESENAKLDATEFEVVSGKDFAVGMLIREM